MFFLFLNKILLKILKKVENGKKKFQPAFGCMLHSKTGQNAPQLSLTKQVYHSKLKFEFAPFFSAFFSGEM